MERPLIYYFISVFIGAFVCFVLNYNYIFSALLVTIFIGIIYFNEERKNFVLIMCFFVLGLISFYLYFNLHIGKKIDIRIIEDRSSYYLAEYKGRKVKVYMEKDIVKEGQIISAEGNFIREVDYFKGTLGSYYISQFQISSPDLITKLYKFRGRLYDKFSKVLDENKAAVIMAACYGETKYLSFQQKNNYNQLGISHIISVSGFHMAVVYKFLERLFGIYIGLIFSFVYMIFTGSKAATVRAFMMIAVLKFSKVTYNNYDSLSAISFAGLVLILVKPYYILDIGFNLSFLATVGIILFNKKFQKALYKIPQKINESLSITLSAQIFSMPFAMSTLNNVSMFFIPANLILIPIYSIVVLVGNIAIVFYKGDFLFKLISSLLYSLLTAIDGATYMLIKLSPPVVEYNLFYGVSMLVLFITYLFIRKGYHKLKYFPILMIYSIIMFNLL